MNLFFIRSVIFASLVNFCLLLFIFENITYSYEYSHKRSSSKKFDFTIQVGHTGSIRSLVIDPSGKYIITGGQDKTIKIWDIQKNILARTLRSNCRRVESLSVDPSGKYIVAGGVGIGRQIEIWTFRKGSLVNTLDSQNKGNIVVAIDPSGKFIVSGGDGNHIKVWDLSTGELLKSFKGNLYSVHTISIGPKGQYMVTTNGNGTFTVWDIEKGFIHQKKMEGGISSAAIHTSGKHIVTLGNGVIKVWNMHNLHLDRTIKGNSTPTIMTLDPAGKWIVSGNADKTISVWDYFTGKSVKKLGPVSSHIDEIAIVPTGKYIATANSGHIGGTINIWPLSTGSIGSIATTIKNDNRLSSVVIDPNNRHIVSGGFKNVYIWDMSQGVLVSKISTDVVRSLSMDPSGAYIVIRNRNNLVKVWDIVKNCYVSKDNCTSFPKTTVANDPTGRYYLSKMGNNLNVFDITAGKTIKSLSIDRDNSLDKYLGNILIVDPLCKYLFTSETILPASTDPAIAVFANLFGGIPIKHAQYPINVWNMTTGDLYTTFKGHSSKTHCIAIFPDRNNIATGSVDGTVKIWDLNRGCINTFKHGDSVYSVAIDPTGKKLFSGGTLGNIKMWNIHSNKPVKIVNGHSAGCMSIQTDHTGRYVISAGVDNSVRIWDYKTDRAITLLSAENEWLIYSNDGLFASSRYGGKLLTMVDENLKVYCIDQFAIKTNRPDILMKRIGFGSDELIVHFNAHYKKRLNRLKHSDVLLKEELHAPELEILETKQSDPFIDIRFIAKDTKYNLASYMVYVNDVSLYGFYDKKIGGKNVNIIDRVELTTGRNKIEISCINEVGVESYRAVTYATYDKKVKGDLYFIGFGVSNYKDTVLNLQFAAKDVKDLASIFSKMKNGYENIFISTYMDEEATVSNIKTAKALLRDATVHDTFVLFIAGHGLYDTNDDATYYYLTYETDIQHLSKTAARFDLFEDILKEIKPRNKLFLLDTCESGEINDSIQKQYYLMAENYEIKPRTSRAIKVTIKRLTNKNLNRKYLYTKNRYIYNDLIRRSGAIVFSSSQGGEFSYESEAIQNGFFTEEIINSLTNSMADNNGDGKISTEELRDYVSKIVPQKTSDAQHPTVDRDNIYQKFSFPIVNKEGSGSRNVYKP